MSQFINSLAAWSRLRASYEVAVKVLAGSAVGFSGMEDLLQDASLMLAVGGRPQFLTFVNFSKGHSSWPPQRE